MENDRFLAVLFGLSLSACIAAAQSTDTKFDLTIRVRVVNWANVRDQTLQRAKRDTEYILGKAGVGIDWQDCRSMMIGSASHNLCYDQELRTNEYWLRILATKAQDDQDEVLGLAVPDSEPVKGYCCANVSYRKVQDLAKLWEVEAYHILAIATAHEIGHILIGTNSHSTNGIMRARWSRKHAKLAATGGLLFTPEQAAQIRYGLKRP